jgi:arsenate reductase
MMSEKVFNVLFLCTGNSARSILAESILNSLGKDRDGNLRFRAFSAGSHPAGAVNANVLELLEGHHFSIEGLRSKNWDEFAAEGAPQLDFVFTVCDNAAGEVCPVWPGQPMTAHWGLEDPVAIKDDKAQKMAILEAMAQLKRRIGIFTNLPIDKLARHSLQKELDDIGTLPRK